MRGRPCSLPLGFVLSFLTLCSSALTTFTTLNSVKSHVFFCRVKVQLGKGGTGRRVRHETGKRADEFSPLLPPRAIKCWFDSSVICKFILMQQEKLIGSCWALSCASLLPRHISTSSSTKEGQKMHPGMRRVGL